MPTVREILYAIFIIIIILIAIWGVLEVIDRMDSAFIRLMLGG